MGVRMPVLLVVMILCLGGCSTLRQAAAPCGSWGTTTAPVGSVAASGSAAGAALPREDSSGATPGDAARTHVAAMASGDARLAYEAYPTGDAPDLETFALEYRRAGPRYTRLRVLEERVTSTSTANVRVVYVYTDSDVGTVTIAEPGEWWRVTKDAGVWKVAWLAKQ
ncbi:MAG: hypothetical protein C0418_01020 [Coriobacteriaceae bacterium]|nr:hypothetical protein [Coriobacteriaceae bacterium]